MKRVYSFLIILIISLSFLGEFSLLSVDDECQNDCNCKDCSCNCQVNCGYFYRQPIISEEACDIFQKLILVTYIKQEENFIYSNKIIREIFHPPRCS